MSDYGYYFNQSDALALLIERGETSAAKETKETHHVKGEAAPKASSLRPPLWSRIV